VDGEAGGDMWIVFKDTGSEKITCPGKCAKIGPLSLMFSYIISSGKKCKISVHFFGIKIIIVTTQLCIRIIKFIN
jgi:hypothetical protein